MIAESLFNLLFQGIDGIVGHGELIARPPNGTLAAQRRTQTQGFIQNFVSDFKLAELRELFFAAIRAKKVTMLVSTLKPAPAAVTSLATMRSAFFATSFLRAFSEMLSVSAAKPTTSRSPFSPAAVARISGFGSSLIVSASLLRLILDGAISAAR